MVDRSFPILASLPHTGALRGSTRLNLKNEWMATKRHKRRKTMHLHDLSIRQLGERSQIENRRVILYFVPFEPFCGYSNCRF